MSLKYRSHHKGGDTTRMQNKACREALDLSSFNQHLENLVNNVKPLLYMLNTQKEGSDFVINSFLYCRSYARGCQRYGVSTSQSKLELQTSYFVFIDHGALSILMIVIFVRCFCSSNRKYEPLEGATVP
jgi:hypothetical protein